MKRILLIALLLTACSKKKETESGSQSNFTSEAMAKISAVSEDFTPDSLDSDNGVQSMSGGPCGGLGLIACQPNLLKLYLQVSKDQLDMVSSVVGQIGPILGNLEDGASGSQNDGEVIVEYSKTDAANWTLTLRNAQTSNIALYVSVADNLYTLELNMANMPPEPDAPTQGSFQAVIDYTDDNTWSMTTTMLDMECNADDVRAPQNIRIAMAKSSGLWKGKAMLYHPRWAHANPTCATTPSATDDLNMYSDFVGDNVAAKMSVYMLDRTRAANVITSHPLSDICSEFPGICNAGMVGTENPTLFPNSVCVEASDGDATWNTDCSGVTGGGTVAAASFGPAGDWIAPASFYNYSINVGP